MRAWHMHLILNLAAPYPSPFIFESLRPEFVMPIYAYKCESCGHSMDALQKLSDAPLTVCPACGKQALSKQVTAAGFQLKGSGWYATDFKGAGTSATAATAATADKPAKTEAAAKPCGASCACH